MKALIIVDIQNDFVAGGTLEVPNGDQIVPVVNELAKRFDLVVATQDWHPPTHKSFASNHENKKPFEIISLGGLEQVLWPDHCVQGTRGAEFHPLLDTVASMTMDEKSQPALMDTLKNEKLMRSTFAGSPPTTACISLQGMPRKVDFEHFI
jgi:nicotinamidase/pyrazinamidase